MFFVHINAHRMRAKWGVSLLTKYTHFLAFQHRNTSVWKIIGEPISTCPHIDQLWSPCEQFGVFSIQSLSLGSMMSGLQPLKRITAQDVATILQAFSREVWVSDLIPWFQNVPDMVSAPYIHHWYWGCSIWMGEGFQYAIMPNWWLRVRLILLGKCQEVARSQSQQVRSIGMWMRSRACVMGLSGSSSGRVDHGLFMFFLSPSIPQKGSNSIIYHDFSRILVLFDSKRSSNMARRTADLRWSPRGSLFSSCPHWLGSKRAAWKMDKLLQWKWNARKNT